MDLLEGHEPVLVDVSPRHQGVRTEAAVEVTALGHHAKFEITLRDADGVFVRIPLRVTRERLRLHRDQIEAALRAIEAFDGIPDDQFA